MKIEDRALTPLDNWLHLAPGEQRVVRFVAGATRPEGVVAALDGAEIHYRA